MRRVQWTHDAEAGMVDLTVTYLAVDVDVELFANLQKAAVDEKE